MKDAYARIVNGEVFLFNMHISPYEQGNRNNHEPERDRKLLLNKREIKKLSGRVEERGLALVALKVYFKAGKAKVEIGLGRGKKSYDKRTDIAKRDSERDVAREMKRNR